jgi:hypothetical protein
MHLIENTIYYGRSTLVPRYAAGLGIIPFFRVLAACGENWGKKHFTTLEFSRQPTRKRKELKRKKKQS